MRADNQPLPDIRRYLNPRVAAAWALSICYLHRGDADAPAPSFADACEHMQKELGARLERMHAGDIERVLKKARQEF